MANRTCYQVIAQIIVSELARYEVRNMSMNYLQSIS